METPTKNKPTKSPREMIEIISYTAIAAIIIVGSITVLFRMSKTMVSDCTEMGI